MRIYSMALRNYGPFVVLDETKLGSLATIVGKNDVGKSYIMRALQIFFGNKKLDARDVCDRINPGDKVTIEVAFQSLPTSLELEEGIPTTLEQEMLVDDKGRLRIRKEFSPENPDKPTIALLTSDFVEDVYAGLAAAKERELNDKCKLASIDATKAGRGITNKEKRDQLRAKAKEKAVSVGKCELAVNTKDDLWRRIEALLPEYVLFESDTPLGVGETGFQSEFRPIVKAAAERPEVVEAGGAFTDAIGSALQGEVDQIFGYLRQHTDSLAGLTVRPQFLWDKAVTFDIYGKDTHNVEKSLDQRGSGLRRLMMVSFFQYLAERSQDYSGKFIFAIEEPENCLHPGLQRDLASSFRHLANEGYQVIITSHSPVFAGASPIEDLALVVRAAGAAKAIQHPSLDLADVAEELGVEPADQIIGYRACVFVEGADDIAFWKAVASRLKGAGQIDGDFDDRRVGFILCGGDNLKHWINMKAMKQLNRHFGVVIDSDLKSENGVVNERKLNWKRKCEEEGGVFFILRKRAIENYMHPAALARSGRTLKPHNEFTDMKTLYGENVYKVVEIMSCEELLEMGKYQENGSERNELKEIVQALVSLPDK